MSPEWELWYRNNKPIVGWYPDLDKLLTGFVAEAEMVLELGSGSGGNIPGILQREWRYVGIEGSQTAVEDLAHRFPEADFFVGDFTQRLPSHNGGYDLIFDRAAIPHNPLEHIRAAVDLVHQNLKPGGIFISSDWFSANHSEAIWGMEVEIVVDGNECSYTRTGYTDGQFTDVGNVHFSTENELAELFSKFDRLMLRERITRRPAPGFTKRPVSMMNISSRFDGREYQSAVWDIVVRKPK